MIKRFILMILLMTAPTAFAVKMSSLYQAEVPVASQTEAARNEAAKQGLLTVLTRMTGQAHLDKNPAIEQALIVANDFVQTHQYSSRSLTLRYNKGGLDLLLKQAGLTKWSDDRPLVLIWVAQLSPQLESTILNQQTQSELMNLMRQESNRLGLPITFPIMDMADAAQISVHDISSFSLSNLRETSKRYRADALLIGSLEPVDDKQQSHWRLIVGEKQWEWTINERSNALIALNIMEQVSQVLAENHIAPEQPAAAPKSQVALNQQDAFAEDKAVEGWTF